MARIADSEDCSTETVQIPHGPKGLQVHLDEFSRRLTTPWQVCMIRADILRDLDLPVGGIVDPACGAGLQVAALANVLDRTAVGVELDGERACMAAANLERISAWSGKAAMGLIINGDGTDSNSVLEVAGMDDSLALLHFDPARPVGSTTHDLSEMQPHLDAVLDAWKPVLEVGPAGPAIILDLSPRLSESRRKEVEVLIDERWPGLARTWQWASRGSGRIDRLSLWLGSAADPDHPRRFIRIPPSFTEQPLILRSPAENPTPLEARKSFPRKGQMITIIDSALVSSGMASAWLSSVLHPDDEVEWQVVQGRRPMFTHTSPLALSHPLDARLVRSSGFISGLLKASPDIQSAESIISKAAEMGFGRLTLRLTMDPEVQPSLQRELDRGLRRIGGDLKGFITRTGADDHLLLCQYLED